MPSAEDWAQMRHDYEHTNRSIEEICAGHGVSSGTLRDRVRRWGWARRRQPIPSEGPPPVAAPAFEPMPPLVAPLPVEPPVAAPGGDPVIAPVAAPAPMTAPAEPAPVEMSPAQIAQRLQGAVARVLPAIETTLAKLAAGPSRPHEMEHTTRTLGALTRALRELNGLLAQYPQTYEEEKIDIDKFRNELAHRINAFVDRKEAEKREAEAREAEARARGAPEEA